MTPAPVVEQTIEIAGAAVPVFRIAPPTAPKITHDEGFLGQFPARAPTAADYVALAKWKAILEAGEAGQAVPFLPHNDIPDALAAYRHFLYGNGKDREFNYERYVQNDASGETTLANAIWFAQSAAEYLWSRRRDKPGGHMFTMTSSVIPCGTDDEPWEPVFPYPATENWQKAIGSHFVWLVGAVTVADNPVRTRFTMSFSLHAEDRYNFNPGQADIATGIPDDANGLFELTGLGRQYTNRATLTRMVRWGEREYLAGKPRADGPGGRQRKPSDNRRARNRL